MSGLDSFCVVSLLDQGQGILFITKYLLMLSTPGRRLSLCFKPVRRTQTKVENRGSVCNSTNRGACELRWSNHAVSGLWLLRGVGFLHHVRVTAKGLRPSEHAEAHAHTQEWDSENKRLLM